MTKTTTELMQLKLTHVPTGLHVEFPAYLNMFSDAFTSTWASEDVYGRMDPISTFINTRRALSIAWNVPAESYDHAAENVKKVNKLLSFLYPLYDKESHGATAINQSPLLRIKFGNLIQDAKTGRGILGYVNGFTFDPDLEHGMFYRHPFAGAPGVDRDVKALVEYCPKTFRLNTEINVLHEHSVGYERNGGSFSFRDAGIARRGPDSQYPYEVRSEKDIKEYVGIMKDVSNISTNNSTGATNALARSPLTSDDD